MNRIRSSPVARTLRSLQPCRDTPDTEQHMTTQTLPMDDFPSAQPVLGIPDDQTPDLSASAELDLVHAALAYLGQIGRQPAS